MLAEASAIRILDAGRKRVRGQIFPLHRTAPGRFTPENVVGLAESGATPNFKRSRDLLNELVWLSMPPRLRRFPQLGVSILYRDSIPASRHEKTAADCVLQAAASENFELRYQGPATYFF